MKADALPIEQGTDEWFALRAGKMTASKAAVVMGGLDTSGLDSYVKDLAWERVFGPRDQGYKSAAMERGNEVEPEARDWYANKCGEPVRQVAFVDHPSVPMVGCSPDGLRNERGVEIKCPLHKAWMEVKRTGKVPSEYRWQVRWSMWVCGLDAWDFVAYHPVAGGLLIPCEILPSEKDQMAERAAVVEARVQAWQAILTKDTP